MGRKKKEKGFQPYEYIVEIPNYCPYVEVGKKNKRKLYINGNLIWSGSISKFARAAYKHAIEEYITPFIEKALSQYRDEFFENCGKKYRLKIELEIHKREGGHDWDTDNQWVWTKAFNDCLKKLGYIVDDNRRYIKKSGGCEAFEIPENDNVTPKRLLWRINLHDL